MIYLDVTEQVHFVFWICKYYQCILCDSSHKIKVFTYLYLEIVINKNEEFHVENRIFSISIKLKYVKILIPMKHFFLFSEPIIACYTLFSLKTLLGIALLSASVGVPTAVHHAFLTKIISEGSQLFTQVFNFIIYSVFKTMSESLW